MSWESEHIRYSNQVDKNALELDRIMRKYESSFNSVLDDVYKRWSMKGNLKAEDIYAVLTTKERALFKRQLSSWMQDPVLQKNQQFMNKLSRISTRKRLTREDFMILQFDKITTRMKVEQGGKIISKLHNDWLDGSNTVTRLLNESFTVAGDDAIYKSINKKWHGSDLMSRMYHNAMDLAERWYKMIKKALGIQGKTQNDLSPMVKYYFSKGDARARTIMRTEATRINSESKMAAFKKLDIKYFQFIGVVDSKITDVCRSNDMKITKVSEGVIGKNLPPLHFNCLLGETLISSRYRVSNICRRVFKGDIYTITTKSGRVIKTTPNHPMLTDFGFRGVDSLDIGDNLILDKISKGNIFSHVQNEDGVSTIGELFESLVGDSSMLPVSMPMTAKDFHGDGIINEKVNVININSKLWNNLISTFSNEVKDSMLKVPINNSIFHNSYSTFNFIPSWGLPILGRLMTGFNLFSPRLRTHNRPLNGFLLGLSSYVNALSSEFRNKLPYPNIEPVTYGTDTPPMNIESNTIFKSKNIVLPMYFRREHNQPSLLNESLEVSGAYSELASNILNGHTLDSIELDEIVDISIAVDVLTHVYNLENELGYYTANNLITHNCRSSIKPYIITKTG